MTPSRPRQSATTHRLPDGQYGVTLEVIAQKLRADNIGRETPTPMNDLVEVGVFASGKTDPFYLTHHRIRTGKQTLRIIVPQEPERERNERWQCPSSAFGTFSPPR